MRLVVYRRLDTYLRYIQVAGISRIFVDAGAGGNTLASVIIQARLDDELHVIRIAGQYSGAPDSEEGAMKWSVNLIKKLPDIINPYLEKGILLNGASFYHPDLAKVTFYDNVEDQLALMAKDDPEEHQVGPQEV